MSRQGDVRPQDRLTVLYDGECGLCRFIMGTLVRWDRRRRLRPLALQTADAIGLLPGMGEETRMESIHIVDAHGNIHSGGRALPPIFRCVPGGKPIAWVLAASQPLTDRWYGLIARHRSAIGPRVPRRWKESATRRIEERQAALPEDVVEAAAELRR